jgi:hypothetical protein
MVFFLFCFVPDYFLNWNKALGKMTSPRRSKWGFPLPPVRALRRLPKSTRATSRRRMAMRQMNFSAQAYHRTRSLKLARTIADLGGSETIQPPNLAEALQYRPSCCWVNMKTDRR